MKTKEVNIFDGFRVLYEENVLKNNNTLTEVWINEEKYIFPLMALKLRFELEFFWKRIRMVQPGRRHELSEYIKVIVSEDQKVVKFIYELSHA